MAVLQHWPSCAPSADVLLGFKLQLLDLATWSEPEVLAEYVWLDADGVTRSKTMTMTARLV